MALTIANNSKSNLNVTNTEKDASMTWAESDPLTWGDDTGVWSHPRRPFVREDKNALSITNDNKI